MSARQPLCERLRAGCHDEWESLHAHPFVQALADGSLPVDSFRFYLEQNLQYLPEYARAMALGASRADDLETMRVFASEFSGIVDTEIPKNEELLRRALDLGAQDRSGANGMAPATVAYTSFLVGTAAQGTPLEIMAATLPCTWSYGEIGARLVATVAEHPLYADWIRFFGSPDYGSVVEKMRRDFEAHAETIGEAGSTRLQWLFATSVGLERRFWDMAYNLQHWPDVTALPV